jgi:UDP-3-O-[3-hydroxymyristoyl] glucosamine N-acyltransferase
MADPRFFDNRGPFTLAEIFSSIEVSAPADIDGGARVFDVAGLSEAGPPHLSFFDSMRVLAAFQSTKAGWCLVGGKTRIAPAPSPTKLIPCASVGRAFAAIARLFYPEHELDIRAQEVGVHPSARIGSGTVIGPGAVVGPEAYIGNDCRIGANAVIGRGVTIGRGSQIGPHAYIAFAHLGDEVLVQPGAVIGGSGFGFNGDPNGLRKCPQLGRVIVQDRVEIGANSTIDRGALGDTVIGEGTKIDNLVQIGHNCMIGRHCILVSQVGLSGSIVLGDGVVLGGKVGVADHLTIGDGAQVAARAGVTRDLEGGRKYAGFPARPLMEWRREALELDRLGKRSKKTTDE